MSETPAEAKPDITRVKASIENWKRKLLDLTKRNRALNFKVHKVSTVTVVDELPAEVFRQLYIHEGAMKFKAAPEDETKAVSQEIPLPDTTELLFDDDDDDEALHHDFVPYELTDLEQRHTDNELQTTSPPEALDKSLRRLEEQARLSIEEQGVNPLFLALGMLHYTESTDSKQVFKAPLILLPVELTRKSARSGYLIKATEEEPIVNPALAEYLKQHQIQLPDLPDSNNISDDYDLQTLFSTIAELISDKPDWSVKTDIYLALFSFQKFVMYKDLEANTEPFSMHRLIKQLVLKSGSEVAGLPKEIREMKLDDEFAPETTFQVVDADASQLRAIAACSRNYDLVVEGPPGTGKSQTITNLIAQALSVGKSVLFVAEKMAALEVVYRRIVDAGLGEACLELHSTKANKRNVIKELAAALDASLQSVAATTSSTQRLPQVRTTLSEYVEAVHQPWGTFGMSPFRVYGELGQLLDCPRVNYTRKVDDISRELLDQTVRDIQDLAATSTPVGIPNQHPWRDSTKTFYSADDLQNIHSLALSLANETEELMRLGKSVESEYGFPKLETLQDIATAVEIGHTMRRSPGAPLEVLTSDEWNAPPVKATDLIKHGREFSQLRARASNSFNDTVLTQEHSDDITYIRKKSEGFLSFLSLLDNRYRSIKKRWRTYRLPSFNGSMMDQAEELAVVDRLLKEKALISSSAEAGRKLFGALWLGEDSSWDSLETYVKWVVSFRGLCVKNGVASKIFDRAVAATPETVEVDKLETASSQVLARLKQLAASLGWPTSYLEDRSLTDIVDRARNLVANINQGPQWAGFEIERVNVQAGLAAELLPAAMSGELTFKEMANAFLSAFYSKWLTEVVTQRPALARFNTLSHEQRVQEFKELDQRVLRENRAALVGRLRDRVQNSLQHPGVREKLPYLKKEMARQRRHAPLRRTMSLAGEAIRAIKPCFMMSPLTVAQLLDANTPPFDLVIFDEASQLPPEDAVGAIGRGNQLVVVGDPKQLPPTNFFQVSSGLENAVLAEDGTPIYEDSESVLEDFMGSGAATSRLKWHYRSAHESLISFSNVSFYDAELYTFPSIETGTDRNGLTFEFVENGVYEGKGLNQNEARRVVDEVVLFAKEQLQREERGEPRFSLGVGTFNLRQQLAIQDELELRRRADPQVDAFFSLSVHEPFFVKNLENIQGDERDVIFLSVTYAKAADGKLRYNFGPLNSQNGRRRLNVIITRARQKMRVFSSIRGDDINPAASGSEGPQLLRDFLKYAETGRLESTIASLAADTDSPLEKDILSELSKRGVRVVPQVGVAGYKIDLGILDHEVAGRFICGIECDGVAYHSSETARDRDRLRQEVLELRGWNIHRVWSTDWFKDRQGQIDRLMSLIEGSKQRAIEEVAAERTARDRAAKQAAELVESRKEPQSQSTFNLEPYQRPVAETYVVTKTDQPLLTTDFLKIPSGDVVKAVVHVVQTESPIHKLDLLSRVAGLWGFKMGQRIQERILSAAVEAEKAGTVARREDFFWNASTNFECQFRSRAGTRIPGDRIAPEEYELALMTILSKGHTFARNQLVNEVRSVFGFSRTGPVLDEAINAVIDSLTTQGKLGEGSLGIGLRK